jgi:hypothetical protein
MLATIQMRPDRRGLAGVRPLWSRTVSRDYLSFDDTRQSGRLADAAADEPPHERAQLELSSR